MPMRDLSNSPVTARRIRALLVGMVTAGIATGAATADDSVSRPRVEPSPSWEVSLASYVWASGMRGTVATLPPAPPVGINIGFDKVLQNLDGGIMGAGELRHGRYIFAADVIYAKLSASVNPKGPGFTSASIETSSFVGTFLAGYRVVDDARLTVDAMAGIRATSVWTEVSTTSLVPILNITKGESEAWVDPIVGGKVRYAFADDWYLTGWGFVGGFGVSSKLTWDLFAGVGYQINHRYSVVGGYRALGIDYVSNGYRYDIIQHGPIVALTARF